jgi:hypothetical protein
VPQAPSPSLDAYISRGGKTLPQPDTLLTSALHRNYVQLQTAAEGAAEVARQMGEHTKQRAVQALNRGQQRQQQKSKLQYHHYRHRYRKQQQLQQQQLMSGLDGQEGSCAVVGSGECSDAVEGTEGVSEAMGAGGKIAERGREAGVVATGGADVGSEGAGGASRGGISSTVGDEDESESSEGESEHSDGSDDGLSEDEECDTLLLCGLADSLQKEAQWMVSCSG